MKEYVGWGGSDSFVSMSFDSVVLVVSRVHQALNTLIWLAIMFCCGSSLPYMLFIFMVNWKEVYLEPCKTSDVELFAKPVNSWKPLIFLTKSSILHVWKDSEYATAAWKENCKFWLYIALWNNMYLLPVQYICHFSSRC